MTSERASEQAIDSRYLKQLGNLDGGKLCLGSFSGKQPIMVGLPNVFMSRAGSTFYGHVPRVSHGLCPAEKKARWNREAGLTF